jgi:two-component system chemotaxis response regulator CheV
MGATDTGLLKLVDEKTRLVGSNRMELLLFSLGGREMFGINVFKVREVCETPEITRAPNMPRGVLGIISLRGSIIPVIDLAAFAGDGCGESSKLIITEFAGHTQGFRVADVDRIVRVDWNCVKTPQGMLAQCANLITAITELPGGRIVSILDVEQVLHDALGDEPMPPLAALPAEHARTVFFVDDSQFARRKIIQVLDQLALPHQHAINGRDALDKLAALAAQAELAGQRLRDTLGVVLVDAEMPEMDGYVLTQHVKADRRFADIPVVMHSSLSSVANRKMGQQVGVDAYVAKFSAESLAGTVADMLRRESLKSAS